MSALILFGLLVLSAAVWLGVAAKYRERRLARSGATVVSLGSSLLAALVLVWSSEPMDPDLGISRVDAALLLLSGPVVIVILAGVAFLLKGREP